MLRDGVEHPYGLESWKFFGRWGTTALWVLGILLGAPVSALLGAQLMFLLMLAIVWWNVWRHTHD